MKGTKGALQCTFAVLFAASLLMFWLLPFTGQKEISETENRALEQLPVFTPQGFFAGTFQDSLENAVGDQLLFSEEIRTFIRDAQASALGSEQALLYRLDPSLKSGYAQITEGYYTYRGDEDRIVERPREYGEEAGELSAFASPYNAMTGVGRYLYFIHNSRSVDFDRPGDAEGLYEWVASFFDLDGAACFSFSDYEDYCKWFYQTDHHWNDLGFYRGYTEIMSMLRPGEEPVGPGMRSEISAVFNGSYARVTQSLRADEPFTVRSFDLPKHAVTINGRRGTYGRLNAYLNGRFADEPLTNHYAVCYGGDYGEIAYDFGTEGRGRLLVISSSYSNPINALIASHFDQTWVIDLRYYADYAGHDFDPASFVSEHGIDTVLLLGDIRLFLPGDGPEGGGD